MESAGITDREKAGLRGPVRTSVEEAVYPTGKFLTATEYSLDGRLLTTRTSSTDGSEWLTTQTYDANGQLAKIASGKSGEPGTESLYSYDETGRLLNITNHPQKGSRIEFRYDGQGRKTAIQTFDAETLQRARNAIFAGSAWDAAVGTGIGVPAGGKITTSYDENEQPTEAQILDAEGQVVTRFLRIYDSNGQLIEEKSIWENPAALFLDKMRAKQRGQVNPEHLKQLNVALVTMMSGNGPRTRYTYDPQNRLTNLRERNLWFGKTTRITYNERGDKAEERTNVTENSVIPIGVPDRMNEEGHLVPGNPTAEPPASPHLPYHSSVIRYAYQYDSYGNWTQQIASDLTHTDQPSTVRNRKLTYY